MQKVQGWVENGSITVAIANTGYVSSTKVQGSFPSGTVTVYLAGTLTIATIYSDNSSTAKANPFTAASSGQWFFYAPNGAYDVKFSGGGIAAPFTLGDIRLFDETPLFIDVTSSPYLAKGNGSTDDSTAINLAVAALAVSGNSKRLYFPAGVYAIASTVTFSALQGIEVFGAGDGSGSSSSTCGSALKWIGAANGTMMTISSCQWSQFHNFRLDANSIAGVGLHVTGSGTSCQRNSYDRLTVANVLGTSPGYGFRIGASSNPDVSQSSFTNCTSFSNKYGLYQEGTQTVAIDYYQWTFTYSGAVTKADVTTHANFAAGDVTMNECTFLGPVTTSQVTVAAACDWARFTNMYHEVGDGTVAASGPAYLFPSGNRPYPTLLSGCRIKWDMTDTANNIINYLQNDLITIVNTTFDTTSGNGRGNITFDNDVSGVAKLVWINNKINGSNFLLVNIQTAFAVQADQSANLAFGGSAPGPFTMYAPSSGYARFMLNEPNPQYLWKQSDGAANNTTWDAVVVAEQLRFRLLNDARNSATNWMTVDRTANTVDDVDFPSGHTTLDQAFSSSWNGSLLCPTQNAIWDAFGVLTAAWTAWTPTYASDIGNAAATYSGGTVTTNVARYIVIGKLLIMQIGFSGTLNAVTPQYLSVTLPASLSVLGSISGNVYSSVVIKNNNAGESGAYIASTNTIQFYRVPFTGLYTASQPAGVYGGHVVIETS